MIQSPLHRRGADGRCQACGEVFPCGTADRELVERRDQDESDRLLGAFRDSGGTRVSPRRNDELATRTDRLVRALEDADAPPHMIQKARDGGYDDFRSTRVNPHDQNLIGHARKLELWDIARRAQAGEFDAP